MTNPMDNIPVDKQEQWHQNLSEQELLDLTMIDLWQTTESEKIECQLGSGCENWSEDDEQCEAFNHAECPVVIKAFNLTDLYFQ